MRSLIQKTRITRPLVERLLRDGRRLVATDYVLAETVNPANARSGTRVAIRRPGQGEALTHGVTMTLRDAPPRNMGTCVAVWALVKNDRTQYAMSTLRPTVRGWRSVAYPDP